METLDAIRLRCSLKTKLSEREVPPDAVEAVLRAACLAPSARNSQPWRFVVVRGREAIDALAAAALPEASAVIRRAPVIVVACALPAVGVTVGDRPYFLYDVGSAVQNLLLAATDRGLATHLIASFDEAAVKRVLRIPDDVRVVVLTPLAWPDAASYQEAAAERLSQRTRLPFEEVVFEGFWGGA
ncbi:MAG: nitroreductase family protein [Trueperaceae bacterium]|nr:nitroreductase family protein [Trueperaceae bacterium]